MSPALTHQRITTPILRDSLSPVNSLGLTVDYPVGFFYDQMKTPQEMTRAELLNHIEDLYSHIDRMKNQVVRSLEAYVAEINKNKDTDNK